MNGVTGNRYPRFRAVKMRLRGDWINQPAVGLRLFVNERHAANIYRLGIAIPVLLVGGCAGPLSTLDTAGPVAGDIASLWWVMLIGAAMLTLLVLALLALAFRQPESSTADSSAVWMGWLGLAMPSAVLACLLGYALVLGNRTLAYPTEGVIAVEAIGQQWYWTFRVQSEKGVIETQDVLHVPAGRPINVRVASTDVIHSFWVPRLGGKMDAIPGHANVLRIQADKPGVYGGLCAEFCGERHANHMFRVIAYDDSGWSAFLEKTAQ